MNREHKGNNCRKQLAYLGQQREAVEIIRTQNPKKGAHSVKIQTPEDKRKGERGRDRKGTEREH